MIDTGDFDRRPTEPYQRDAAFALYERHLDGEGGAIDELMYYCKRFFLIMISKTYPGFSKESKEEILSICLVKFWRAANKKVIKRDPSCLHGYMRRMVERMGRKIARTLWGRNHDRIDPHEYMRRYFARIPDTREIEAQIFVTELPLALRKRAMQYSDLLDPQQRGAAQYVVNRVLSRERIVSAWLKSNYDVGVKDMQYYVEHAGIVIRRALYGMQKECLNFSSDEEKRRIIDGGVEAYLCRVG